MGHTPPAPAGGSYRVVRIQKHVTEATVTAGSVTLALEAAKALAPQMWHQRHVLQYGNEDSFEYDVVQSDGLGTNAPAAYESNEQNLDG